MIFRKELDGTESLAVLESKIGTFLELETPESLLDNEAVGRLRMMVMEHLQNKGIQGLKEVYLTFGFRVIIVSGFGDGSRFSMILKTEEI